MDRILQLLRKNLSISRYSRKGVYLCKIGTGKKRPPNDPLEEVVYTLCMGDGREEEDAQHCVGRGGTEGPIMMSYLGAKVTMRPWDPKSCIIAAGLCNNFIHWPIQPGGWVIVVDCSLSTLSHIADIIGANGRLVGVIDTNNPEQPTDLQRRRFLRQYKSAFLVVVDVKNATLQDYELSLGVPRSSKHALYMGLHPRVGADSQVRTLLNAPDPAPLFCRIFEFLECKYLSRMECLVFCHCPPGIHAEGIRDVIVRHLDILRHWQSAPAAAAGAAAAKGRVTLGDLTVATSGAAAEAEQEDNSQQPKNEQPQAGEAETPPVEARTSAATAAPVPPPPVQMPPPPPPSQTVPPPQSPSSQPAAPEAVAATSSAPPAESTSATATGRSPPSIPPPPPAAAAASPPGSTATPAGTLPVQEEAEQEEEEAEQEEQVLSSSGGRPPTPETSERSEWAPPQWVLLGLSMDHIETSTQASAASEKINEIVDVMKRLSNGTHTGLMAKEQLLLVPHFPNHALVLLKSAHHRSEGHSGSSKLSLRPKKESSSKEHKELQEHKSQQKQQQQLPAPPTHEAVPLPSFGAAGGCGLGKVAAVTGRSKSSGSSSKPALAQTEEGPTLQLGSGGKAAKGAKQPKTVGQQQQRERQRHTQPEPPAPGSDGRQWAAAATEPSFGQQGSRSGAAPNFAPPAPRAANRQACGGTQPGVAGSSSTSVPSGRAPTGSAAPTTPAGPAGQQALPSGLWDTGALARPWQMEGSGIAPRTDHLNFSSWGLMNTSGAPPFMMPQQHGMGPPPGLQAPQQVAAPPGLEYVPWADGTGRGLPPPPALPPRGLGNGEA